MTMTRAAIYTRISQDATGKKAAVTRQFKASKALANRLGVEVVGLLRRQRHVGLQRHDTPRV
jgi:hypothetical protein